MSYEVRCECGKAYTVGAADAGVSFPCGCGKVVEVPPFHQLRTAGGETAVPLLVQVRGLIANGLLPGKRECVCCRRRTQGMMRIGFSCEPLPSQDDRRAEAAVGCLFGLFTGSVTRAAEAATSVMVDTEPRDYALAVPLPVCDECRPALSDPAALRQALRHIPEYAALLDHYPKAELTVIS